MAGIPVGVGHRRHPRRPAIFVAFVALAEIGLIVGVTDSP